ncbi:MAG: hypothetical protein AABX07_00825 [Nanoarchaeota archaeon]
MTLKEKISKKIKKAILDNAKNRRFLNTSKIENFLSVKEKALTAVAKSKQTKPLKLEMKIKPEKLEDKIEQISSEKIPDASASSSQAFAPSLQTSPQQQITEERNYSNIARERRYASQRAEQLEQAAAPRTDEPRTTESAGPRTTEAERTPYSTIVLYSGAQQRTTETARAYEPGENTMRRAMQMANRLANKAPQPKIEQDEMFENKMPDRTPQNASEKVNYSIIKPEEQKPKRRYPWEG